MLKKKLSKILGVGLTLALLTSLLVTAVPAAAQDGSYLGTPPTIDGDLSEWEAAGTQYIYADGCLGEDQIGTGKLYMAFDDDNFYLAYELESAPGDNVLYAFNGGFWFPDASGYDSSGPPYGIFPSEHVLTDTVLELRQSWSGVRGAEAVYGEWMLEIVCEGAARIIRLGSMQATTGLVTNLDFYAGSYDGEDPYPGSHITDGVSNDLWVLTGFSVLDPHFGQYSVVPLPPDEVWVDDGFTSATLGWGVTHFAAIQPAIDAVAEDGTVTVAAGIYDEGVVINVDRLTLKSTVAHGANIDGSLRIEADDVSVLGFKFTGQTPHWNETHGILVLAEGALIEGNLIDGLGVDGLVNGIMLNTYSGGTVSAVIRGNHIMNVHMGIYANPGAGTDILVEANLIEHTTHCSVGLDTTETTPSQELHRNSFLDCGDLGVEYFGTEVLDATENWWGHASGPTHATNPSGTGGAVSDFVDFDPWAIDEGCTKFSATIGAVGFTTNIVEKIAITVFPTSIDFGSVVPGVDATGNPITVTNAGNVAIDLSTTLTGDELYTAYLYLDDADAESWVRGNIGVGFGVDATPKLSGIPAGFIPGNYTATLIFWAEMH